MSGGGKTNGNCIASQAGFSTLMTPAAEAWFPSGCRASFHVSCMCQLPALVHSG